MDELYMRQWGIIHPDKLNMPILIVGAGSIGSWTALALSKLGCSNITIADGDTIEVHNAASQVYKSSDLGEKKVDALLMKMSSLTDERLTIIDEHWEGNSLEGYSIIIAAVDNITVRSKLFNALPPGALYIDARMAGNALEIYTVKDTPEDKKAYEGTLFSEEETLDIPCSERSVVYNVFCVAGLVGDLVAKYANEQEIPKELIMDLFNLTLYK